MRARLDTRLAVVALSVLLVAVGTTAAQAADPGSGQLEVTITDPTTEAFFGGLTPITVHITGDGTATPTQVQVVMTGTAPWKVRSGTVSTLDRACASDCDVTVTVDTMSWQDLGDDPQARPKILGRPDTYDPTSVVATVEADTAAGPVSATSPAVSLRAYELSWLNERVSVDPGSHRPVTMDWSIPQWRAPSTIRLVGTLFGNGPRRDFTISPTVETGYWSFAMDVDPDLPAGTYPLRLAVVDDQDRTYAYLLSAVRIYSGPRVTDVASLRGVDPDTHRYYGAQLVVHATVDPYYPSQPKSFAITIDGWLTQQDKYSYDEEAGTFTLLAAGREGGRLAPGPHKIRVDYREGFGEDERTQTGSWEGTVTTAGVVTTPKVTGPVVEGLSGTLTVTLAGMEGSGTPAPAVRSWRITDNYGAKLVVLGSGTCIANCATVDATVSLKGLIGARPGSPDRDHYLQVQVTDSTGVTRTTTVRISVDPLPRTTIVAPPRAGYGAKVKLVAVAQAKSNDGLPGVPIAFQARVAGTSTWRTVANATTNRDGLATAYVTVTQNTQWRFLAKQRVGYNGPATSATVGTVVPAKAVLSGTPTTGTAQKTYRVATTVYPRTSGRAVYVQVRKYGTSRWVTVASSTTDKYGVARAAVRLGRGTWAVRSYVRGIASSAATYSPSVKTVMR